MKLDTRRNGNGMDNVSVEWPSSIFCPFCCPSVVDQSIRASMPCRGVLSSFPLIVVLIVFLISFSLFIIYYFCVEECILIHVAFHSPRRFRAWTCLNVSWLAWPSLLPALACSSLLAPDSAPLPAVSGAFSLFLGLVLFPVPWLLGCAFFPGFLFAARELSVAQAPVGSSDSGARPLSDARLRLVGASGRSILIKYRDRQIPASRRRRR
jgi:hypothetical protein